MTEKGWKAGESGDEQRLGKRLREGDMRPKRERETRAICRQSVAAPSPMRAGS